MLKQNLLKRVVPFLLSLAMAFQSVPMTAVAVEGPQASTVTQETDTPAESTTDPAEEASGSKADETASADIGVNDSGNQTGMQTGEGTDHAQTETDTDVNTETTPGAGAESDENTDSSEGQTEAPAESGADKQAAVTSTEITVEDAAAYGSFKRVQGESRLTYTMPYSESGSGNVLNTVIGKTSIIVNGEKTDALKTNYLFAEWREVKDGAVAEAAMTGTPQNVGSYAVHLETREQEGVCGKAAYDVYFNITPKELTLNLSAIFSNVKSGSKVADLQKKVADSRLLDGGSDFTAVQYTVAAKVYASGEETETTDTVFSKNKDYLVKVEITFADADAAKNYEAPDGEYPLHFATSLAVTNVEVKTPGREMVKTYAAGTEGSYTAAAIAAEYGVTAEVKAANADGTEESLGADKAVAKWYGKEIKSTDISGFPLESEDGITQFVHSDGALYTLMTADSAAGENAEVKAKEVGDYYLVYVYEGEDGLYKPAHSDPLKFTIDPVSVTLRPTEIGELNTGMTRAGLKKALAEAGSKLYNTDVDPAAESDAPVNKDPEHNKDFYGVSYDDATVTQYYSPVFELVRFKKFKKAEDQNWPAEWSITYETIPTAGNKNLPAGIELGDGKTVDYDYYVRFTGDKAVYDENGEIESGSKRPITEATDAANRNYKVKTDDETLNMKDNMFRVEIKDVAQTEINVEEIIKSFKEGRGKDKEGTGLTVDSPAQTIYDMDAALFADRAAYKKAVVTANIKDSHEDITYEWQKSGYLIKNYYEKLRELAAMQKTEGETDEAFGTRKEEKLEEIENGCTWTAQSDLPQDAGLYRLHITYKDSALVPTNAPAEADAYFLVRQQELLFVADTQYAEYDQPHNSFLPQGTAYSVYLLPDNDESKLDLEKPLGWQTGYVHWNAMNLKKDGAGANTAEWELSSGNFKNNYVYKAAVRLRDSVPWSAEITDTDGKTVKNKAGDPLKWSNYTTANTAVWNEKTQEYEQHIKVGDGFGDIVFGAAKIQIDVDRSKIVDKTYDGVRSAGLPEGLVTLKNTDGTAVAADKLKVNEYADGVGTVEVAWKWLDFEGNDIGAYGAEVITRADEVRFGGVYRLVARFGGYYGADGTAVYAPYDPGDTGKIEWVELSDADGKFYEWTINPLKITIAPDVKSEVTAGEALGEMVEDWHVIAAPVNEGEKIPDGTAENQEDDRWLFEKAESDSIWNAVTNQSTACKGGYPILGGGTTVFTAKYYEDNIEVSPITNHRVRFGKKYDIKLEKRNLWAQYQYSYEVTMKAAQPTTICRGDADVRGTKFFGKGSNTTPAAESFVSVYPQKDENGIYQIQPREGIPFVYDDYRLMASAGGSTWENVSINRITGKKIPLDKNYIAVNIVSPSEFGTEFTSNYNFAENNFVYENSIREAGGYVLKAYGGYDSATANGIKRYFITALFPVEQGSDGKVKAIPDFKITWETGYTDTFRFDLTNAQLEANLKEAVAPKSITFNGVQAKMAVGEEQQLDVKMTKAQLGDVIRIHYRLQDGATSNKYASINPETGLLTALATENKKPVKVDIEAYSVRLAADGKTYEEITGKGVKIAKTKVTISEVTAPAIKKVIPQDTSVEVQFAKVDNGYRGEIYVKQFADKKAAGRYKAADFETAIGKMKNGQWQDEFAVAPMYFSGTRGYVEKLKLCKQKVDGLEKGFYAIYVRNVSAVRTLADGTKTTESAAGSAKTFETTKSQVQRLMPYFEVVDGEKTKANPVRYYDEEQKDKPSKSSRHYMVELADKSAQLVVDGYFKEKPLNPAADAGDRLWLRLPLKTAEKMDGVSKNYYANTYLEPKLTYYVTDNENARFDSNHKLLNPSKLVTISNKGKLTFKGVDLDGELTVRVHVQSDNGVGYTTEYCTLTITARPDTITTKKPKPMKVGDAIRLRDYIEYKKGKTKVPNYWSSDIEITNRDDIEKAGYEIYQAKTDRETHPSIDGTLRKGEYIIIARKNDAKALDLIFTDWVWKAGSGDKVKAEGNKIALKAAKLDPVKKLKTVYTDDKSITINFTHSGHPEAFDIEVKDARGSVVYKRLVYRNSAQMAVVPADLSAWYFNAEVPKWMPNALTNLQRANLSEVNLTNISGNLSDRDFVYFEKNKTYAYTVNTEKLMRLSSYTVSVVPVYEGECAAKPASTKAKTTNIPASYANGDVRNPEQTFRGVVLTFNGSNLTYLTSGNTYTVRTSVTGSGAVAQSRGTDTLTWKSSNAKVASIKANQGSFTATLKALQQGKTTITVTSKVTKKTIARYHIAVKAVGKANGYGGDYENGGNGFYDDFVITVDPYYEGRTEVLTVSNPVHVTSEDYLSDIETKGRTWVKFTAPSYGEYTFNCKNGNNNSDRNYKIYYSSGSEAGDVSTGTGNNRTLRLEEGQTIYFRIVNQSYGFTLSVSSWTDFMKLTTSYTQEKPLTVGSKAAWISFTAPEDNEYRFNSNKELGFEQNGQSVSSSNSSFGDGIYSYTWSMKAGETIFIKVPAGGGLWVTKREFIQTALTAGGSVPLSITKDNKNTAQYVKFTAAATGEYIFTYSPGSKLDVTLTLQDGTRVDDGGMVVSEDFGKAKALNANGDVVQQAADEGSKRLFMQSGETIVIVIQALATEVDSIVDDASKIDVTVQAAAPVMEAVLAVGEQTVKAATTQMFYFAIPIDTAVTKYSLTTTNANAITWYYGRTDKDVTSSVYGGKKLADLSAIKSNGNSFTVENGVVISPHLTGRESLYAGDKIYLEVTADAAADAKVTLTKATAGQKTFDVTTPATAGLTAANKAEWHTFTAKKSGYYAFSRKVTMTPETATAQSVTVATVDKVLDTVANGTVSLDDTPVLTKLEAGDYVFRIAADGEVAENVTATVTLFAKEIVPTVLAKGDNAVTVPKGETGYYVFKRETAGDYTITWTPGADVGTPTLRYTTGDLAAGSYNTFGGSLPVNDNNTYIIKVTADDAKDLSGSLQVIAKEKKFLTNGETITLTKNGLEDYIFTTPQASELGYVVIAENVSVVAEGQTEPKIALSSDGLSIPAFGRGKKSSEIAGWTAAKTDHTVSITASDVTEAAEGVTAVSAAVKITIKPITAAPLSEAAFQVKKDEEPRWFTYTLPADDRYVFDYTVGAGQDKSSVLVNWYERNEDGSRGVGVSSPAVYLPKGQKLYAYVIADSTIADAGVDVTLAKPASLKTADNTLTIEAGKTEVTRDVTADDVKDGVKYYVFKAPAYARYEVALAAGEGGSPAPVCLKYIPVKNNDLWMSGMALEKDQEILIKVQSAGKLTVTQDVITQLTLGAPSAEITLAQGEEAAFALDIFKDAYYDFTVSGAKNLSIAGYLIWESRICYEAADGSYFVSKLYKNDDRYEFTLTNTDAEAVKIKVTAKELMEEPVRLKVGENSVPIEAGRVGLVEFNAPEDYWYTVARSEGSVWEKLGEKELQVGDVFLQSVYDGSAVLYSCVVVPSGTEAVTAKIIISKVVPETVSGTEIPLTLAPGESKWYTYQADKAGTYTFTIPTDAGVRNYYDGLRSPNDNNLPKTSSRLLGEKADFIIRVENKGETKIEGETGKIAVVCEPAAELKVGENTFTNETAEPGEIYMTFRAEEDGAYQFTTSNGSVTCYGRSAWKTSVSRTSHVVRKGDIVYLKADTGDLETTTITVTKEKAMQILDYVSVESGKYQWITYTAPKDGKYTFYSTGNSGDPKAWFFKNQTVGNNATNDTLNTESYKTDVGYGNDDDSSPEGNNFLKELSLSAGETVYIAVGHYSLNDKISCYVCVEEEAQQ